MAKTKTKLARAELVYALSIWHELEHRHERAVEDRNWKLAEEITDRLHAQVETIAVITSKGSSTT